MDANPAPLSGEKDVVRRPRRLRHGLKFPRSLERQYLRHHDQSKAELIQFTFGIGAALYLLLLIAEWQWITQRLPQGTLPILITAGVPNVVPPVVARFMPQWRRWLHVIAPSVLVFDGIVHVQAIAFAQTHGIQFPYGLLAVHLTFLLLLSGTLVRHAIPLGFVMLGTYVVRILGAGLPGNQVLEYIFVLGADFVLCSIAGLMMERSERNAWLKTRQVRQISLRDHLTGLSNRRHLFEQGPQMLRQARREKKAVSALFADVDYFKLYNDSLGHMAGDVALRTIAETLRTVARRPLDLVTRPGGEEFVLLLYDCDLDSAIVIAEEARSRVEALAIPHPRSPLGHVTISLGVASSADAMVPLRSLLNAADQALYQSKAQGRNSVRCYTQAPPRAADGEQQSLLLS
jgi:diguanylate cyclase (GGDEF)-like protein